MSEEPKLIIYFYDKTPILEFSGTPDDTVAIPESLFHLFGHSLPDENDIFQLGDYRFRLVVREWDDRKAWAICRPWVYGNMTQYDNVDHGIRYRKDFDLQLERKMDRKAESCD